MEPWIRILISRDMPHVLEIERDSFEYPWSESEFTKHRKRRGCVCLVAEFQELIVGYIVCDLFRNSIHIDNIAVDSNFRLQGVGRKLVARITEKLNSKKTCVTADVRDTNLVAQLFLRGIGFKAVKINKQFYDNGEDSFAFVYRKLPFHPDVLDPS